MAAPHSLAVFRAMPGGLDRFLETGPPEPAFLLLARQLQDLERKSMTRCAVDPAAVHAAFAASREYFLTQDGKPRSRLTLPTGVRVAAAWDAHRDLVVGHAGEVSAGLAGLPARPERARVARRAPDVCDRRG